MAEQLLYGDEIDIIIKHVADDGAMHGIRKDGHDRARLGRSARGCRRRKSVHADPAAASRLHP
jgi:hypothetical protein